MSNSLARNVICISIGSGLPGPIMRLGPRKVGFVDGLLGLAPVPCCRSDNPCEPFDLPLTPFCACSTLCSPQTICACSILYSHRKMHYPSQLAICSPDSQTFTQKFTKYNRTPQLTMNEIFGRCTCRARVKKRQRQRETPHAFYVKYEVGFSLKKFDGN